MRVSDGRRVEIVAEIGANHGSTPTAIKELIDQAARAGATAVKVQLYRADKLTIRDESPGFIVDKWPWLGRDLYSLYKEGEMPGGMMAAAIAGARTNNLKLIVSVFDEDAIREIGSDPGVYALKIASFELVDVGLIAAAARTGKPLIISTGMATMEEVADAVEAARGAAELTLLHCVSSYPTHPKDAGLPRIAELYRVADLAKVKCRVGFSDHTLSTAVPAAAVAFGAKMIEKHIKSEANEAGLDDSFSLDPLAFAAMVRSIREVEAAVREPQNQGREFINLRRSLYVVSDIPEGGVFTKDNVRSIRPGYGLRPKYLPDVLGKVATKALKRGHPLVRGDVVGLDAAGSEGAQEA